MEGKSLKIPRQQYFVGDLVIMTGDKWPSLSKGEIGIITYARCHKVCIKGGLSHLSPEDGGPEYTMEWAYVGRFDMDTTPQGVRIDRLSPVEVINESR